MIDFTFHNPQTCIYSNIEDIFYTNDLNRITKIDISNEIVTVLAGQVSSTCKFLFLILHFS